MKDVMLLALIAIAEAEEPIEHDVTLLVGGLLVSGFIISADKFMKHHQTSTGIWNILNKMESEEPQPTDAPREYIHLRGAKYYFPGAKPIPDNTSIFVRISLESVHGFSFGKLEFDKN
jgi:hypothetical protein